MGILGRDGAQEMPTPRPVEGFSERLAQVLGGCRSLLGHTDSPKPIHGRMCDCKVVGFIGAL